MYFVMNKKLEEKNCKNQNTEFVTLIHLGNILELAKIKA